MSLHWIDAGADGYLLKDSDLEVLLEAIVERKAAKVFSERVNHTYEREMFGAEEDLQRADRTRKSWMFAREPRQLLNKQICSVLTFPSDSKSPYSHRCVTQRPLTRGGHHSVPATTRGT